MLSRTSEYALRIMAFLAGQPVDAMVPAVAMEGRVHVPANYRGKILTSSRAPVCSNRRAVGPAASVSPSRPTASVSATSSRHSNR